MVFRKNVYKKRPVGRPRRSTYKKRRTNYRRKTYEVSRIQKSIPDRMFVRLRYVDTNRWSVTSTSIENAYSYQSSLYRPRTDNSTHQPMWFDQYCPNMFSSYRVFGISYRFVVTNVNTNEAFYVGVRCQNQLTADTQLQTAMERKDAKWRMGGSVNGGNNKLTISGYMSVAKTRGETYQSIRSENDYRAAYNASPSLMAYIVPMIATNLPSGTASFDTMMILTYHVELADRVTPSGS